MRTRTLMTIGLAFMTTLAFSQRKEIRNAEDALESGNYSKAKTLLKQAETQISGESDNRKEDFYLAKAQAYLGASDGKNTSYEDLMVAVEAYKKLQELGKGEASKKGILAVRNALVNSAIADQKAKNYTPAAKKLYKSYQMGKQDTIYLYYAASNAVTAKNYDTALKYYKELMELGYDGAQMQYLATDKKTGEIKPFPSKNERDLFIKSGQYIKPENKMSPSKTGEIAKNIALIYIEQDKPDMAMQAMKQAKAENPDDIGLLQAEANIYYNMGKLDKYNQLMQKIIQKDPENPILYYNLAVTSDKLGDREGAIEYYKKAIEYDPKMENAYVNLAATILKPESKMLDKMNKALSAGDNATYDQLAAKRKKLYNEALPYLTKVLEINPKNIEATRTLMNIYYVLGKNKKAEEMKAKLDSLEK